MKRKKGGIKEGGNEEEYGEIENKKMKQLSSRYRSKRN